MSRHSRLVDKKQRGVVISSFSCQHLHFHMCTTAIAMQRLAPFCKHIMYDTHTHTHTHTQTHTHILVYTNKCTIQMVHWTKRSNFLLSSMFSSSGTGVRYLFHGHAMHSFCIWSMTDHFLDADECCNCRCELLCAGPGCSQGQAGQTPTSPPHNAVGCPITGVVCCEGGLLTAGADGVVLHHSLR